MLFKRPKRKDARIVIQIGNPDNNDVEVAFAVLTPNNDNVPLNVCVNSRLALRLAGTNIGDAVIHVTGVEEVPIFDDEMDEEGLNIPTELMNMEELLAEADSDSDSDDDSMDEDLALPGNIMQGDDDDDDDDDDSDDSDDDERDNDKMSKITSKQQKANGRASAKNASNSDPKAQNVVVKRGKGTLPVITHRSGLRYQDVLVGSGKRVVRGHNVALQYVLRLESGKIVDKADRRRPFKFRLGIGECVKGFDIGVMGMREGGERHLIVPPELGYGDQNISGIPGGSTLYFDVSVVKAF